MVIPKKRAYDDAGSPVYSDDTPVTVTGGMMQPVSSTETDVLGTNLRTVYRWISRGAWPGGAHSTVVWEGRTFDQDGEARVFTSGRYTHHVEVLLVERAPTSR